MSYKYKLVEQEMDGDNRREYARPRGEQKDAEGVHAYVCCAVCFDTLSSFGLSSSNNRYD